MKAEYYREHVGRCLVSVIPDGKRPKRPFVFSRKMFDEAITRMARKLFSLDVVATLGALNAMYWFAEYLSQREAIWEQARVQVQAWCEELWSIAIAQFIGTTIEARAFDTFPH